MTIPGEPHLGYVNECELIADDEEVFELLWNTITMSGDIPSTIYGIDDYTDDEIEIDTAEWFGDKEMKQLEEWLYGIPEDIELTDEHMKQAMEILGIEEL